MKPLYLLLNVVLAYTSFAYTAPCLKKTMPLLFVE